MGPPEICAAVIVRIAHVDPNIGPRDIHYPAISGREGERRVAPACRSLARMYRRLVHRRLVPVPAARGGLEAGQPSDLHLQFGVTARPRRRRPALADQHVGANCKAPACRGEARCIGLDGLVLDCAAFEKRSVQPPVFVCCR